jgi:hypothetical protein
MEPTARMRVRQSVERVRSREVEPFGDREHARQAR